MSELRLRDDATAVSLHYGDTELLQYVYRPDHPQLESPRPYAHPLRTLAGDLVTIYRPHDHVWHKGLTLALPNVGEANFWGGVTWVRDQGYVQLPNNGSMRHDAFEELAVVDGSALIRERLSWVTEPGEVWFKEQRRLSATAHPELDAWVLSFETELSSVTAAPISIGSPTTRGRPNAGYGGLFWRGPRSFTGGTVQVADAAGADELMGVRSPWLAFTGVHDGHGRSSTVVIVDAPTNPGHPTAWFVRSTPFAAICPAPFFDIEFVLAPGEALQLRYAVVIADGDGSRAPQWATLGSWMP
jgi:hypothetical protein